jgi:hypothetical protein
LGELHDLRAVRPRRGLPAFGLAPGFDRRDLAVEENEPFVLAADLRRKPGRQRPPVAGARVFEARQEVARERLGVADPLRVQRSALIRLVWAVRSLSRRSRSRFERLSSSSSGLGTCTIEQARGSPRRWARKARMMRSRSIRSVFARRARRLTSMLEGSISWLTTPWPSSLRCSQCPSKPAS